MAKPKLLHMLPRKTETTNFTFMLPCIIIHFFLNNQPDALTNPILFCYKTPHVSGIFSAHHQEFSTVHSALVSFMQVLMTASKQSQDRLSNEHGSQVHNQGRQQCCHNKHNKFPYRPTRDVSLLSWHDSLDRFTENSQANTDFVEV